MSKELPQITDATVIKLMEILESNIELSDTHRSFIETIETGARDGEADVTMWHYLCFYMDERGYDRWEAIGGE